MNLVTKRSKLFGQVSVPGSKSYTIRSVLLASLAEGISMLHNPLSSHDGLSALNAANHFGAEIKLEEKTWVVKGKGDRLTLPTDCIDCGNSGSTAYFSASIGGLLNGYSVITGDEQIRRRPIKKLLNAINQLGGIAFTTRPDIDACPAVIRGKMKGGDVLFYKSLSQFVSSILMVSPLLENDTQIFNIEPMEKPYLLLTIDTMKKFGVELESIEDDYSYFKIKGQQSYTPTELFIPADWSSIVFLLVAGAGVSSEIIITDVDFNDSQGDKAVVDFLIQMGVNITKDEINNKLIVKGGDSLTGNYSFDLSDTPDALPALSVLASQIQGEITFTGLEHVRLKETDRVSAMENELKKVGVKVKTGRDFMVINGGTKTNGNVIESHSDHRIAMAMVICGLFSEGETIVKDCECINVSFPSFYDILSSLGANIKELK